MTGYESKRAAAQAKTIDEVNWADHEPNGLAQPAQEREALKLALEFVENVHLGEWQGSTERQEEIVTVINKALAQPAQEPVGYAVPTFEFDNSVIKKVHYSGTVPLYTTPPQRPWVGLTDELQAALWEASRAGLPRFHTYATLIEKELRILNT